MAMTEVKSQITGSVWKIEVSVGDEVMEDDTLLIMESMKMEIPLLAPEDGVVKEINVVEGDSVSHDTVLIIMEV